MRFIRRQEGANWKRDQEKKYFNKGKIGWGKWEYGHYKEKTYV